MLETMRSICFYVLDLLILSKSNIKDEPFIRSYLLRESYDFMGVPHPNMFLGDLFIIK